MVTLASLLYCVRERERPERPERENESEYMDLPGAGDSQRDTEHTQYVGNNKTKTKMCTQRGGKKEEEEEGEMGGQRNKNNTQGRVWSRQPALKYVLRWTCNCITSARMRESRIDTIRIWLEWAAGETARTAGARPNATID